MEKKIIRIKDIAEKAQVSTGTVDRVIHNRGRVAADVKERVNSIIKQLNYEPNLMARVLSSRKTVNIAALIPDAKIDAYWSAPKAGIKKAESEFRAYGAKVDYYTFNPYKVESFVEKAEELTKEKPDAIILSPIFYKETLPFFEKWKSQNIPFVLFNTEIHEYDPLSYIGQDSYQSGLIAAKLIHYGNPDPSTFLIAHIDEETTNAAHLEKKEQGFRDYFEQHHLSDYTIVRAELNTTTLSSFLNAFNELLRENPELKAIYVTTSKAHEIANLLQQKLIRSIKIVGYDLISKNIKLLNNGMISFLINQHPKGQGYWGVSHLVDHLVFKKEVPMLKYLPLDIVTKENLNYYLDGDE
ncbi:Catabolite control protein A [compost metagenome]